MKTIMYKLFALMLFSCTSTDEKEEMKEEVIDNLVFEFHDSSVPPPYHRSYSLEFKGANVQIVVDSYGDILTDTTVVIGEEQVTKAFEFVKHYNILPKEKNEEDEGCTGGTGISVSYGCKKEIYCDGYVYSCAGEQFGNLSGDLEGLKSSLKGLVPNFNKYLKEE